jgi:hypothetical protein
MQEQRDGYSNCIESVRLLERGSPCPFIVHDIDGLSDRVVTFDPINRFIRYALNSEHGTGFESRARGQPRKGDERRLHVQFLLVQMLFSSPQVLSESYLCRRKVYELGYRRRLTLCEDRA